MILHTVDFEGTQYTARQISFQGMTYIVSTESLMYALLDDDAEPINSYAEFLDDTILYYLPDNLIDSSCHVINEILKDRFS